jgi:outer membrane murein-binding lipoprotein Lpp
MRKLLVVIVVVLGVAVLAGGIASIVIGRTSAGDVTNNLKNEKISLAVFEENAPKDAIITNAKEARLAVDTLIKHRQAIAPTYSDLLGGKHFNPADPKQLTYAQAMNLQNAMTTAVLAYGLTTVLTIIGALLLVVGLAIILIGVAFWWPPKMATT